MITKRYYLLVLAIATVLVVVAACVALANSVWTLTPFYTETRLNDLREEMSVVPVVSGSALIDPIEGMGSSKVDGCAIVYIYELQGSNSISLTNGFHEFAVGLPPDVRRTEVSDSTGAAYDFKKDVALEIASLAFEEGNLHFDSARTEAAKRAYSTLFVVGMTHPVYPDGFDGRCR